MPLIARANKYLNIEDVDTIIKEALENIELTPSPPKPLKSTKYFFRTQGLKR